MSVMVSVTACVCISLSPLLLLIVDPGLRVYEFCLLPRRCPCALAPHLAVLVTLGIEPIRRDAFCLYRRGIHDRDLQLRIAGEFHKASQLAVIVLIGVLGIC